MEISDNINSSELSDIADINSTGIICQVLDKKTSAGMGLWVLPYR
jgi:hypothetical protein